MHLCWSHETLKKADWRTAARVNLCFISQLVCAISDLNRLLEYIHYEGETSPQCLRRDRWIMTDPMQKKKKTFKTAAQLTIIEWHRAKCQYPHFHSDSISTFQYIYYGWKKKTYSSPPTVRYTFCIHLQFIVT